MRLQALSDALPTLVANVPTGFSTSSAPHRVLVVGCAYGGISAIVNLLDYDAGRERQSVYPGVEFHGRRAKRGIEITVIDERDGYYHSVGTPLAHVTPKHTPLMWRRFSHLNELRRPNLHFRHGSVRSVDMHSKVAVWRDRAGQIQQQAYDYLIMATGLKRHWPAVPMSGSYEEYLQDGKAFISKIVGGDPARPRTGRRVVIIGAGAVGVEFAGEIKNYYPGIDVTLVHSRDQVLSSEPLPSKVKDKVYDMLLEENVRVILGNRASTIPLDSGESRIVLADGTVLTADFVIDSTQKGMPTTDILPESCLNADKEVNVHHSLMFKGDKIPNASSHFGIGDVIAWSGIKRAGSAMVMGQAAAQNVYASILNNESVADIKVASDDCSSQLSPASVSPSSSSESLPDTSALIKLAELPSWAAVIGIAVGKQCLTYDEKSGMKWGVEVMQNYFGNDLGWAANLKYCQLTDVVEDKVEDVKVGAEIQIGEVGVEPVVATA